MTLAPLGLSRGQASQSYVSLLQSKGANGIWTMQESAGDAGDQSGGGRTMAVTGGGALTYHQTGPGGALPYAMGGWSATAALQNGDAVFRAQGAFTFGLWVYLTNVAAQQMVFDRDGMTANSVWFAGLNLLTGTPQFGARLRQVPSDAVDPFSLVVSTWYFLCLRYTPSTELSAWRNGARTAQNVSGIPAQIIASAGALGIGSALNGQFPVQGLLAGAFHVGAALADVDIQSIYGQGLVG